MSEDELQAIEARAADARRFRDVVGPSLDSARDVPALVAEVRRLRGLLQSAADERDGAVSSHCCNNCPWCDGENDPGSRRFIHEDRCPAFTPNGEVR